MHAGGTSVRSWAVIADLRGERQLEVGDDGHVVTRYVHRREQVAEHLISRQEGERAPRVLQQLERAVEKDVIDHAEAMLANLTRLVGERATPASKPARGWQRVRLWSTADVRVHTWQAFGRGVWQGVGMSCRGSLLTHILFVV